MAFCGREVVERRVYTVTGERASEAEVDRMIETGESETIFQKAILEQGRGHVRASCHLHACPAFWVWFLCSPPATHQQKATWGHASSSACTNAVGK